MNKWLIGVGVLIIIFLVFGFYLNGKTQEQPQAQLSLEMNLPPGEFSQVRGAIDLEFPLDFGAHPDYLSEWWYYTGNLFTQSGRHFAYQLTFFRRGLGTDIELNESAWAADQVYFAHFSIIDVEKNEHQAWEKYSRGGAIGLAGSISEPEFQVWLNNWSVTQMGEAFILQASEGDVTIYLTMEDGKGVVYQGKGGYSQKGADPGNASIYFSQPRLITDGTIRITGEVFEVAGLSWMDHEFGTSALGEGQKGWDWFSIQLDNEVDLMLYQIREGEDKVSPFSAGNIIGETGETKFLQADQFILSPKKYWTNAHGIKYPIVWEVSMPDEEINLSITAVVPDQENRFAYFQYWEGAIRVEGTYRGTPVSGWGFLEMTGYENSMEGLF